MRRIAIGLVAALTLALPHPEAAGVDARRSPTITAAASESATRGSAATEKAAAPAEARPQARAATARTTIVGVVRLIGMAPTPDTPAGDHDGHGQPGAHRQLVLVTDKDSLFLTGKPARPNTRVRVTGTVSDNTMHADGITEIGAAPAPVPPSGTTRVLVMLAHWSTPDQVTTESARQQMFDDSNGWFRDVSYGEVGLTGDVTPWMQIDGPVDGKCYADHMNIMAQAKTAAAALGYDAGNYDNVVLYFPNNGWQTGSDCNGFAGWAYVGAQGTWINGYMDRRVTTHELGHNYGLWHSHSYQCSNGLSGNCSFEEYGDPFDAMGSSGLVGHFSASQKRLLGWLDGRLVDLSNGGTATLAPMATDAVTTTAARVAVSGNRTYWLEYRQPLDFDSALPTEGTDGVLVHVTDPTIAADGGPNLIDVRPSDGVSTYTSTLRAGKSWKSPEGFTFTVGTVTAAGAKVTVDDGDGSPCPDLGLEPDDATSAPAVSLPTTQKRGFCTASDQDWVSFEAVAGRRYRLETTNLAPGVDTVLDLFAADGRTRVATDDNTVGKASRIIFGPEVSGTYRLRAEQVGGAGNDAYAYQLRVALDSGTDGPTMTSSTPPMGAIAVRRDTNVTVVFSEPVTGVSTKTFALRKTGSSSVIKAKVAKGRDATEWVLNPSSDLSSDTRYTVTLTGGSSAIRDTDGNPFEGVTWPFATGPTPTVKSRTPGPDETRVNRTSRVTVTFSEKVTGVDATTFTLRDITNGLPVSATVARKGDAGWELDPNADLTADTRYTVTLTGGPDAVRDLAGNPLVTTRWTFLTGPTPTVTSRTPSSGAKNVSRTADVAVVFSEAMAGVDTGTFRLKDKSGKAVSATVQRDGTTNRWVLDPAGTLKASTKYTVTLTGGPEAIADVAGNPLASTSWTFTTQR